MTLLLIIISVLIFNLSKNHTIRQLCLIVSSLIVYWCFVREGILLSGLLIIGTLVCKELIGVKNIKFGHAITAYVSGTILLYLIFRTHGAEGLNLPIGFSIIMFSGISLMVDENRYNVRYTLLDSTAYLLFFPKILAGPIERMQTFNPQTKLIDRAQLGDNLYLGFKIIAFGAFLKYICSDSLAIYINDCYNGINQLISMLLYAIQFYLDFWAYSLLAVGISKLFGIDLMYNFNCPYRATSFKDFWKRWNISLSAWLKDYVYIPLQSRNKSLRWINTAIVFVISALWHGFTIPFVVWGVLHACFVVLEKNNTISHLVKTRCYSIFVVLIAALLWQTFRFEDISGLCACYAKLFIYDKIDLKLICVLCISVVGLVIVESKKFQYLITEIKGFTTKEVIHEVAILTTILLLLFIFGSDISSQFFYFKY